MATSALIYKEIGIQFFGVKSSSVVVCITEIIPISFQRELPLLHYVMCFEIEMAQEMIGFIFICLPNRRASRQNEFISGPNLD